MLDLLQAELSPPACVAVLCAASAVPATTALRWISTLVDRGLFIRRADRTTTAGSLSNWRGNKPGASPLRGGPCGGHPDTGSGARRGVGNSADGWQVKLTVTDRAGSYQPTGTPDRSGHCVTSAITSTSVTILQLRGHGRDQADTIGALGTPCRLVGVRLPRTALSGQAVSTICSVWNAAQR